MQHSGLSGLHLVAAAGAGAAAIIAPLAVLLCWRRRRRAEAEQIYHVSINRRSSIQSEWSVVQ